MLKNITYNNPTIKRDINSLVGESYTLVQRIKLKGTGSRRLIIKECTSEIHKLLALDNNTSTCSIELRPKGIIVHFRSILETYGLIIPYYQLSVYKTADQLYSLHSGAHKIMVICKQPDFFQRILSEKAKFSSEPWS